MHRDQLLRRSVGIIVAVVLHGSVVLATHALEGIGQREEIGFVSGMQGDWVDRRSGLRLQGGDRIYADSQLQRDGTPSLEDLIAVTFHGVDPGKREVFFACKDGLQCREPIQLRPVWEERKPLTPQRDYGLILQAIASFFAKGDRNWVLTLSPPQRQGGGHRPLGLARLEGETLDVADILEAYGGRTQLPPPLDQKDTLQAELWPVTDAGLVQNPKSPTHLYTLPWADRAPQQFPVPGLQPGLYLMVVDYTSGSHTIRSNVRALLLVLPAERFAMAAAEWQDMRAAVNASVTGDSNHAHELLVAGLVSLRRVWIP